MTEKRPRFTRERPLAACGLALSLALTVGSHPVGAQTRSAGAPLELDSAPKLRPAILSADAAPGAEAPTAKAASPDIPANPPPRPATMPSAKPKASTKSDLVLPKLPSLLQRSPQVKLDLDSVPEEDRAPKLTMKETLARGLLYSMSVATAEARSEGADAGVGVARGALLPRIDSTSGYGTGKALAPDNAQPFKERWEASLSIKQPLFDWEAWYRFRQSEVGVVSSGEQLRNERGLAAFDCGVAYLALIQSQLGVEFAQKYVTDLDELLRIVTERAALGGTSGAEADRIKARVAGGRLTLSEQRAALAQAQSNFHRLIGVNPAEISFEMDLLPLAPGKVDEALSTAKGGNAQLAALRSQIREAELGHKAARGRFMPRIEASASFSRTMNAGTTDGVQGDDRFMVNMTVPLFAGGADLANLSQLAAQVKQRRFELTAAERQLDYDVRTTYATLEAVGVRLEAARFKLATDQKVVAAFKEQMTTANRPLLEVLDAYEQAYRSRLDLTGLAIIQATGFLRIGYLTGRIAPASGLE
jgi:adhesin transport system outer membrane protein